MEGQEGQTRLSSHKTESPVLILPQDEEIPNKESQNHDSQDPYAALTVDGDETTGNDQGRRITFTGERIGNDRGLVSPKTVSIWGTKLFAGDQEYPKETYS